ncbi:UNVERIFIED_CONTAM: hypothetical protein Sindi_2609800 [Sesamum indicum]
MLTGQKPTAAAVTDILLFFPLRVVCALQENREMGAKDGRSRKESVQKAKIISSASEEQNQRRVSKAQEGGILSFLYDFAGCPSPE